MVKVALFDVDGTLVDARVWRGVFEYPAVRRSQVRMMYMRTLPDLGLLKMRPAYETTFRDHWVRRLAGLLRGWTLNEVQAMARWIASDFLLPDYRADSIARLRQLHDDGVHIVLLSTMFPEVLAEIAAHVGADAWLGSRLAVREGRVTGWIEGPACVGPRKADFARAYLAEHRPEVTFADCAAYADSFSDLALLEAVAEPCAVYPDEHLLLAAQERGWPVFPATGDEG